MKAFVFITMMSLLLTVGFENPAFSAGLSSGSLFTATPVEGEVMVFCPFGGMPASQASFICRDNVLSPKMYDYFTAPVNPSANKIELTINNGKKKSFNYDGKKGQTTEQINLWISTLFQKPLLVLGDNRISWALFNSKSELVDHGEVLVKVDRGAPRTCPRSNYTSNEASDCQSQYSICQRYFEQFNYCR